MALFHLSVTQTKRSAGQSAIASAAYRAGEQYFILYNTNRQNNFYCQCEAIGKCEEAFEYGVSRDMQTRDVGRFFSG